MGRFRHMHETEKDRVEKQQKETERMISGWFQKCIRTGQEWADEKHKEHVASARAQLYPDFMEACGVTRVEDIDYDNPHVKIGWLLADPVNQRLAHNPRLRQRFYDKMDEATLEVYNNYVDEYGHTYKEYVETKTGSIKAVMYRRKVAKEEKRDQARPRRRYMPNIPEETGGYSWSLFP